MITSLNQCMLYNLSLYSNIYVHIIGKYIIDFILMLRINEQITFCCYFFSHFFYFFYCNFYLFFHFVVIDVAILVCVFFLEQNIIVFSQRAKKSYRSFSIKMTCEHEVIYQSEDTKKNYFVG